MITALIIPALNEEDSLRQLLPELPAGLFERVIVVNNGSTDRTRETAEGLGAVVVDEPRKGYGAACLAGIAALPDEAEAVVFMDADGSDVPGDARRLLRPLEEGEADLVIGSRVLGNAEAGALSAHQRWGNRLAVLLLSVLHGHRYTDLGPFRAIRRSSLDALGMRDSGFGWTIEMQIRAVRSGLRVRETPVGYRKRRAGRSKISGNLWGSLGAGAKILWTVGKYAVRTGSARPRST